MPPLKGRILLLSVGTGDLERQEETLFVPLQKSIKDGEFERVVLLPSKITEQAANDLRDRYAKISIEISSLPETGYENNADACFDHFNSVISNLIAEGADPQLLVVDFTRGTKAMSAALVLAAVRHEIPRLRYITGERDQRGMVVPGSEKTQRVSPVLATGQRQLDFAMNFFKEGNFAGALAVLPEIDERTANIWPEALADVVQTIRPWAEFYSAWDRLDYDAANGISEDMNIGSAGEWRPYAPTKDMRDWVRELSLPIPSPEQEDYFDLRAAGTKRIATDLLANGLRRIRHHQYEDAFIRAYRVLELLGQIGLFEKGYDSASIPPDDETVIEFSAVRKKKQRLAFSKGPNGKLLASREQAAIFLKHLGDPRAKTLLHLGSDKDLPISKRNVCILIHGYKAVASSDEGILRNMYDELEAILTNGNPETTAWMETVNGLAF
jgi:CRISPR-associated protein (TIGR02710 family)